MVLRSAGFSQLHVTGRSRKLRYWRRLFARRFDCASHVLSALECTSDVVVVGAAVEGEQLQTMRTLHLKAIANPLDPLAKYHRAFRAFDFDFSFDHRCASDGRASYHAKLNCFAQGAKRARSWVPELNRRSDTAECRFVCKGYRDFPDGIFHCRDGGLARPFESRPQNWVSLVGPVRE